MLHNPGRAELSGLLCSESQPCCGSRGSLQVWVAQDRCRATLQVPPSPASIRAVPCCAVAFQNCSSPSHPAAVSGARDALWSGKCHALEGVQAKAAPCSVPWSPWSSGCRAARASERAVGAMAGAQPGEMLSPVFEESAQGLCLCSAFGCQLWFASPQPRFSLACLRARLGEGVGGFGLPGYL